MKNIAVGNVWENILVSRTFVNDKEIHMKAHITNTSDDIIELAKGTMEFRNEMIPSNNEVYSMQLFLDIK